MVGTSLRGWRRGAAVLAVAGLAACDQAGTLVPGDAGADATEPGDAGLADVAPTDFDGEIVPPASVPAAYVVHASPDAPPLRFCFALGAPRDGGLLVGGGLPATPLDPVAPGLASPLALLGLDLDGVVEVLALDATNPAVVASTGADGGVLVPCEGLVGTDGLGSTTDGGGVLLPGKDYWLVGAIPMAAPQPTPTTVLVAVTGCVAGDPDAAPVCPSGYDPGQGNLALAAWTVASTPVPAGAIGAQLLQASSEWEAFRQATGGTTVAGFVLAGDASVEGGTIIGVPVAVDAGFGSLVPAAPVTVTGVPVDGSAGFGVELVTADGGVAPPSPFVWSLPAVQSATWPSGTPDGAAIAPGAGFVFVLVGNPAATAYVDAVDGGPSTLDAGGVLNGHYPHFLALPTGE